MEEAEDYLTEQEAQQLKEKKPQFPNSQQNAYNLKRMRKPTKRNGHRTKRRTKYNHTKEFKEFSRELKTKEVLKNPSNPYRINDLPKRKRRRR